jgi:hypothetical protein
MSNKNYRINLVVDEKMEQVLEYFRDKYPLLKDADIMKMAIGGFYVNNRESDYNSLPTYTPTLEEERSLKKALSEFKKDKNTPSFDDVDELIEYLEN